ncbi:MAG: DUF2318 domain-containing protein [Clostridiaceae bacterium]|jgi:uncharacterized membrane protein|nr:DUF2318 domain-containing protein [Clostridiaceae bacterium]
MGKMNQNTNKKSQVSKRKNTLAISLGVIVLLIVAVFIVRGGIESGNNNKIAMGGDLSIPKSEINENAKFYPYNIKGTNMEILAVKASDGTIRTAFNTCQVCMGSPRAYFVQNGNSLICQNCGNSFTMDMVEQERGGCNPIPITEDDKMDDGANITISEDFIIENKNLFTANWKTK